MPKTYPDDTTLERFVHGKLSRRENLKVAWHLFNSASSRQKVEEMGGREILDRLFAGLEVQDVPDSNSYDRAFSFSRSTLEVQGETRDRDRSRAPKLFAELMRHPVSRQRKLIERTWRFKNYVFAEYLLEQSRQYLFSDPARAEDLSELALIVGQQLENTHYGTALVNDLKAKALAFVGNARRVGSDLRGAQQAMTEARELLEQGTDDPLLRARVLSLESLLRSDQRIIDEALELIEEAISIYTEANESHWVAHTLVTKSAVLDAANRQEEGVELLKSALELVDEEHDPRLAYAIQQSLASNYTALGQYKEARKLLPEVERKAAEMDNKLDLLRLQWLKGKLAVGTRKWKEAERTLNEVRESFVEMGLGYDAASVSLDLALLYAEQGRTAEMKQLAGEMLPLFRSRDIHREAGAALMIFQKAAAAERASFEMLKEISEYLRVARNNPELRYKAS